jgi:hypothetical protein
MRMNELEKLAELFNRSTDGAHALARQIDAGFLPETTKRVLGLKLTEQALGFAAHSGCTPQHALNMICQALAGEHEPLSATYQFARPTPAPPTGNRATRRATKHR